MSSSPSERELNYVELSVTDMARARSFYAAAFGWQFNDYGPNYSGIRSADGAREAGGLSLAEEVVSGGPLPLMYARDLEATRQAVLDAGGTIAREIYAFPGGWRFYLRDTEGNVLGVYSDP